MRKFSDYRNTCSHNTANHITMYFLLIKYMTESLKERETEVDR